VKLVLQIAFGVFIGALASKFAFEGWREYQENKARQVAEKVRLERQRTQRLEGERMRALLLQGRQLKSSDPSLESPSGFVNDDAKTR
jgi:hypothetical protein